MLKIFSDALSSKWAIFAAIVIGIFLHFMPQHVIEHSWAIGLMARKVITFGLPFVIFALIGSGILQTANNSSKLILFLVCTVIIMNMVSFWILYPIARFTNLFYIHHMDTSALNMTIFKPTWEISVEPLLRNDIAVLIGLVFSIIVKGFFKKSATQIGSVMAKISQFILKRVFTIIVYIFICGFISNIDIENFITPIVSYNYKIILIIVVTQWIFMYMIMAICNGAIRGFWNLKNTLEAALIGFTSMSSGMAFPKTLEGLKKNGVSDRISSIMPTVMMPSTLGDCITISALVFFTISLFNLPFPDMSTYFIASIYYAVLKFSCCCMPGGLVMSVFPVFGIFGFSDDMCMLIASMTIFLDPFTTMANTVGHGAFGILCQKLFGKMRGS